LRWAQGGAEVFLKQVKNIWMWRRRRMWPVMFEYVLSITWAYAFIMTIVLWGLGKLVPLPEGLNVPTILPPAFWGLVLATTNLMQFLVALMIESRYEPKISRWMYWIIWYPMVFWMISLFTSAAGFPKALFKKRGKRAIWTSPDRGFRSFTPAPPS